MVSAQQFPAGRQNSVPQPAQSTHQANQYGNLNTSNYVPQQQRSMIQNSDMQHRGLTAHQQGQPQALPTVAQQTNPPQQAGGRTIGAQGGLGATQQPSSTQAQFVPLMSNQMQQAQVGPSPGPQAIPQTPSPAAHIGNQSALPQGYLPQQGDVFHGTPRLVQQGATQSMQQGMTANSGVMPNAMSQQTLSSPGMSSLNQQVGSINQQAMQSPIPETVPTTSEGAMGDQGHMTQGTGIDARTKVDPKEEAEKMMTTVPGAPGAADGRVALLQSALVCELPKFLVEGVLENSSLADVKDPAAVKVHSVGILKLLIADPGYGMKFQMILDDIPSWKKYKSQDHSLFITGHEQKTDYFLTDGSSGDGRKMLTNG